MSIDPHKRLISEARVLDGNTNVYALTYSYDQLGNRRTKTDTLTGGNLTGYVYDTDWDPVTSEWKPNLPYTPTWTAEPYVTRNNRLLEYKVYGPEGSGGRPLLRTVHYTYYATGHASNITIKDEWTGTGDPPAEYARYHDLALYYGSAGSVWLAVNDSWTLDEESQPVDYQVTGASEFRYDGGGQRYMTRLWDTPTPDPFYANDPWTPDESAMWTESVGGLSFGDFEAHLDGNGDPVTAEAMRYLAGAGLHAQQTVDGENNPIRYLHGDLIDSTMMMTDEVGAPADTTAYTAFGELVTLNSELATRYQYAGGYGYESGLVALAGANESLAPITLQHVGARWYDPALGRFLQRDPIGIDGGLNVYLYCDAEPLTAVDPEGLMTIGPRDWWEQMRHHNEAIAALLRKAWVRDAAGRVLTRQRLRGALRLRNLLYRTQFGPLALFMLACDVGAWAGEAFEPTRQRMQDWYRDWTYGGRGGLRPGELWD